MWGRRRPESEVLRVLNGGASVRQSIASLCLYLLLTVLTVGQATAAMMEARLDLETQNGYGRMIVTFEGETVLPTYDVRSNNGVLVLDWSRPVRIDLGRTSQTLEGLITVVRQDPDYGALRFALSRDVRINTIEAGERLFVDFLPSSWTGPPPPLPDHVIQELAERAKAALERAQRAERRLEGRDEFRLELNVGLNPTFTRYSFDWNAPFNSSFVRKGDEVLIGFDQYADLDVGPVKAAPPPGLVDILTGEEDDGLRVLMVVDPRSDVRAFKIDNRYVVDVSNPDGPRDPSEAPSQLSTLVDAAPPSGGDIQDQVTTRGSTAPALPVTALGTQAPAISSIPAQQQQQQDQASTAGTALSPPVQAQANSGGGGTGQTAVPATRPSGSNVRIMNIPPSVPATTPGGSVVAQVTPFPSAEPSAAPEATGGSDIPPEHQIPLTGDRSLAEVTSANQAQDREVVRVNANRIGNVVRMVFPFPVETPGAVFRRGNSVWVVFETPLPFQLDAARVALADHATGMDFSRHGDAAVLRVDLNQRYLTGFGIDATSIVLTIGDRVLDPSAPLEIVRSYRGDGALTLRVPFRRASRVFELPDPTVGDVIQAVTGFGPARGLLKAYDFAELSTLVSSHGVAVTGRADDVDVVVAGDDVIIGRPDGLRLSFSSNDSGTSLETKDSGGLTGEFIEFMDLHIANPTEFQRRIRQMEYAIIDAEEHEITERRLELARFYLANRFAHEALAQLRVAGADDPQFAQSPGFHVLMGAAQILAHREETAARHLSRPNLQGRADAAVWQTVTNAALHDWPEASEAALIGETVVGNFPPDLQATFFLAAARAATELNDYGSATRFLSQIEPGMIDPLLAAEYDFLRGRVANAAGRPELALKMWENAGSSDNLAVGAEAQLALLKLRHQEGRTPVELVIEQVEQLTLGWRGDETEIKALRFLAQLYADQKEYRQAFQALEAANLAAPQSENTRIIQEEMAAVFATLFLDGADEELDPVKALSLFYDHRNLVPIGRRGDEMVRRLARKLVDLDLLDQAAELLRHQVDNRLSGAASAQVASELALVYILDHKPESALNTLARTRMGRLPDALQRQRRILEARALSDVGRREQALTLLDNMNGPDAQRLRAENLWALKRWGEAGLEYEAIPGNRWQENIELTEAERHDVLRAAISFTLQGDEDGSARVRAKYGDLMAQSPDATAFEVVTSELNLGSVEFRAVAEEIASVDTFQTFLDEYRKQYDPALDDPPMQVPAPLGEEPVASQADANEAGDPASADGSGLDSDGSASGEAGTDGGPAVEPSQGPALGQPTASAPANQDAG